MHVVQPCMWYSHACVTAMHVLQPCMCYNKLGLLFIKGDLAIFSASYKNDLDVFLQNQCKKHIN